MKQYKINWSKADNCLTGRKRDAGFIQLWRRITKTEYPSPPDTGNLPVCGQLPDRNIWAGVGRTGTDFR